MRAGATLLSFPKWLGAGMRPGMRPGVRPGVRSAGACCPEPSFEKAAQCRNVPWSAFCGGVSPRVFCGTSLTIALKKVKKKKNIVSKILLFDFSEIFAIS